jgi:peptide/nickel transport system ATP-binding protein
MTALNPTFTVGEQLVDVLRQHRRVSVTQSRDRAVFLLNKVGIDRADLRLGQYPHQLSGGLRQRVVIAMALMCGPDLLLADEPTTALDVTIQAELLRLLAQLRDEFKMTMVLITHDLGVVSRLADHVAVMYAGEIVEYASARQIFERPAHPYTRGLLECLPSPRHPRMTHLQAIPGHLPSLHCERNECGFRERCSLAVEPCGKARVLLRPVSEGHEARCLRAGDA